LHKRLFPPFPNIDPHEPEMLLTSLLARDQIQLMFLKKRNGGLMFSDENFSEEFVKDALKNKHEEKRVGCRPSQNR